MAAEQASTHQWQMDSLRTRLEISVIVYRCKLCGCLQIKDGGPDAPSVFKPSYAGWNPFRTLPEEPPCQRQLLPPADFPHVPPSLVAGRLGSTATVQA